MSGQYGEPLFGKVGETAPTAATTHGKVSGENRDGVAVFRGIPYGADCGGARRFLPPEPAADWAGVRDCTRNGQIAPQHGGSISNAGVLGDWFNGGRPERFGCAAETQDEDCLVLNVVTPGLDGAKRPVLVYIHGGGYATGSGSLVLGADRWAREEDLVVVGVNHRLNVFGYLYLGDYDPKYAQSGVAGILDLVLALEWVRDNIAAFGGDPSQVTIMGESGGGMKVCTLLATEGAGDLFRAAVVESGSCVPGTVSKEKGAEAAGKVLDALGIRPDELDRLADVPTRTLLEASLAADVMLAPVADGKALAYNPTGTYRISETAARKPLLVGSSEDEMAVFTGDRAQDVTWDNIVDRVHALPQMSGTDTAAAERIVRIFREHNRKDDAADHLFLKIESLSGFLAAGAFEQALASARMYKAPVFHYVISYDAPHPTIAGKRYAWHTADLPLQLRIVRAAECEPLSRLLAHAWAAFIRSCDPSTETLPWPAFTADERRVMVFDDEPRVERDPLAALREALAITNEG